MKYLFLPLALLWASASATAAAPVKSTITVGHAYSYPTAAPGVPGVGFLTLTNTGKKADRLLSAKSPAAGSIEIHQSKVVDGVMQMRALSQGVSLPAGKQIALAPGGLHLMLFDLRAPLVEGERVPLTLSFERAGVVTTELLVEPRETAPSVPVEDHPQHQH